MRERNTPPRDIYQEITDSIVAAIENGVGEARLPWLRTGMSNLVPKNALTGNAYHGVNLVGLWAVSQNRSYSASIYATFKQWQQLGAQVRKGERGSLIVFYKSYDVEPNPEDEADDGRRLAARHSIVFNCQQVDGYDPPNIPDRPLIEKRADADAFFAATGIKAVSGGDSAHYAINTDTVHMPDERLFTGADEVERALNFYSVKAHEFGHATGAKHRLNRDLSNRFGTAGYAMEELVAELISAMVLAHLGMSAQPRPDHACYIANWLKVLKQDKKAIFAAAARAQEATSYLIGLQAKEEARAA